MRNGWIFRLKKEFFFIKQENKDFGEGTGEGGMGYGKKK